MPLFEYKCLNCERRIEVLLDADEPEPKCCPDCSGKLKRLMGVPGLIFKGSGFYATDYARKSSAGSKEENGKTSEAREHPEKPEKSADTSNANDSKETSDSVTTKA